MEIFMKINMIIFVEIFVEMFVEMSIQMFMDVDSSGRSHLGQDLVKRTKCFWKYL